MEHYAKALIKDREYNMRTYPKCFVGSEAIDWLYDASPHVHSRFHALATWQALLEEGIIKHGNLIRSCYLDSLNSSFSPLTENNSDVQKADRNQ